VPRKIATFRPHTFGGTTAKQDYERAEARRADKRFYAGARWIKLRDLFRRRHPVCATVGCNAPTAHVHHVIPRDVRPDLAYEWDNLEGLCIPCHNAQDQR
jgi:5-methylcytosine-specific restriction endonuclease McrA